MNRFCIHSLHSSSEKRNKYATLPPLAGPDGEPVQVQNPSEVKHAGYITKNCNNPEAAFRIFDIMHSNEMTIMNRWGLYGTDWVDPEPGDTGLYEDMGYKPIIKDILAWGTVQNSHWFNGAPHFRTYEVAAGLIASPKDTINKKIAERTPAAIEATPVDKVIIFANCET